MSYHSEQALNRAKSTLLHYFHTVFEAAGLNWSSDNVAEVEGVVDDIYEAVTEQAKEELRLALRDED